MQKILYSEWVYELVVQDHSTDINCEFYRRVFGFKTSILKSPV